MKTEASGLTSEKASALIEKFGKNTIEREVKFSSINLLISQYKNIITVILLFATLFSIFIGDLIDAVFIFTVLLINGVFGFIQEYRSQKTMEKLKDLTSPRAFVIRNGQETEIDAENIVPQDLVVLREGDRVPADGKITSGMQIEVNESILTGESLPQEKGKNDTLYAGTFIVRGRAYLSVAEVGFATKLGQIAKDLEGMKKPKIPLVESLNDLGKKLAIGAVLLSFILIPIGAIQGREIRELILIAVSTAVALIPEGLPLVVTVALAVGAFRMAKRKTIVRKMASIETLGATTVILSDKTGTITENKMIVKKHWVPNEERFNLLLRCAALGNTANLILKEGARLDSARQGESLEMVGDPTDGAILSFAQKHIDNLEYFRSQGKIIEEKPFDPEIKLIEVKWEHKGERHTFLRGSPETIIKKIAEKERIDAEKILSKYAKEGLRVIAFAHKKESLKMNLLGFVGIYDAPREEAVKAIAEARAAGISIVMVTGDNPITAKSISEEVGLISEGELVLTHDEIEKMSDEEILELLPSVKVFARMIPEDKLRLVRLYKQAGHVVAVTGDGVNDALALSEAHIGVAMGGRKGTDVAREASDIVITDDNLYTIVRAVEEGRGIYDNIVKVVVFLLSTNFTEFFLIFFAILFGLPIPLTPTQILWINLIGDGLPAMALASDTKTKELLLRKPRRISEGILNWARLRFIFGITFVFSLILLAVFAVEINGGVPRMLIFNLIVVGEMIILFIIRGGIFPINRFLIFSVILTLILQYLVSTIPYFKILFGL